MAYSSLLFLPLLLLLPIIFHFCLKRKKKNHPPGPPGLPIIGNVLQLGVLPHRSLWEFSQKYGDVMLINLGNVPTIVISSAEAAKEILKTHDAKTCSKPLLTGPGKLSYNYLDAIFTPYGNYWRDLRKTFVLEFLCAKRVESFRFVREEEVSLMIDSIFKSSSSSSSSGVNLSEKTLSLVTNVICRIAFGYSLRERVFSYERFQEVIDAGKAALESNFAADYIPYLGWIVDRVSGLHSRLEKNFQELDALYEKIIDDYTKKKRNNAENGEKYFIDILLERPQNEFSKDHVKATLMNILLPGLETGAAVLVWAMTELVKNPRVMKKVQEEIRNFIGSKDKVSESDINKFGYLKMVLKETLRLHPPGTFLFPREAMSGFNMKGYEIYPKTRISVNVWAIGRDPKIWKSPEEFYPERFMGNNRIEYKEQNNYEMLPFGGGRRECPGASMGMALVELSLANLLFCFDWEFPNNMKLEDLNMEEVFGFTTHKKEPLMLVPVKYQIAR